MITMLRSKKRTLSMVGLNANRRIDPSLYENQFCMYLADKGFSTHCIVQKTKLSYGQVQNRLRKCSVKLRDYRNGYNDTANTIVAEFRIMKDR